MESPRSTTLSMGLGGSPRGAPKIPEDSQGPQDPLECLGPPQGYPGAPGGAMALSILAAASAMLMCLGRPWALCTGLPYCQAWEIDQLLPFCMHNLIF